MKKRKKGQVTLDFALALICILILFFASAVLFFWVNGQLVKRQQYYESQPDYGRVKAAGINETKEIQVNEEALPKLDFFKGAYE